MDSNNNSKKCPHGFYLGPNGEHIIPNNVAVSISQAAERHNNEPPVIVHRATPKTDDQKAFEASVKKWQQYYKDNQGKIPNPDSVFKTIFDKKKNEG